MAAALASATLLGLVLEFSATVSSICISRKRQNVRYQEAGGIVSFDVDGLLSASGY
jgi:hypothetical protein